MAGTFNDGLVKGKDAGGPIVKKTFVTYDPTDATGQTVIAAGLNDDTAPCAVSKFSVSTAEIAQGKGVSAIMDGRAIVTVGAAGAMAVRDPVTSDAAGKARVAVDGDWFCGTIDQPGVVGGDCVVLLADPGNKYYAG